MLNHNNQRARQLVVAALTAFVNRISPFPIISAQIQECDDPDDALALLLDSLEQSIILTSELLEVLAAHSGTPIQEMLEDLGRKANVKE